MFNEIADELFNLADNSSIVPSEYIMNILITVIRDTRDKGWFLTHFKELILKSPQQCERTLAKVIKVILINNIGCCFKR